MSANEAMHLRPRRRRCINATHPTGVLFDLLPDDLLYHVLSYAARPTETVRALCHSLVPLNKATRRSVEVGRNDLWSLILEREYRGGVSLLVRSPESPCSVTDESGLTPPNNNSAGAGGFATQRPTRSSKRQRLLRDRTQTDPTQARDEVQAAHLSLCERTDDAHSALASLVENSDEPLSLLRLRRIFRDCGPDLAMNRRSQWGRTFLIECCAANFVCESVILRCVQEVAGRRGTDPNVWTRAEHPDAERPAIFFAVARVMPSVVRYLIEEAGASLAVEVTGRFRLVSNPSESIQGTFTPLGFAKALREAEVGSFGRSHPYWFSKLNKIIRMLSLAEKGSIITAKHGTT
uniref:Uncharacterized protein n=1 Tax=Odontella aurita TaxID=265563 RepID=A0A7S4I6F4_9STRA|mmetsp:Transcript_20607/g.59833  ORF Transcript_20607/g.59833 Transcript_20607/m.59833 type:complete len:349 (+) Transcript_20607:369-1415(+)